MCGLNMRKKKHLLFKKFYEQNRVGPVITRPSHTTWHAVRHQGGSSKHPYVPDAVRRAFSKLYHPSDSSTLLLRPVCRGLQVTMCQYRLLE